MSFVRVFSGWIAGCGAATGVIVASLIFTIAAAPDFNSTNLVTAGALLVYYAILSAFVVFLVKCMLSFIPALIIILLAAWLRIRSIIFFAGAGAAAGAMAISVFDRSYRMWSSGGVGWFYVVAGLAAGATYWLVAVRHVDHDRHPGNERA